MKLLMVLDNLKIDSGVSSIVIGLYRNMPDISTDFLIFNRSGRTYIPEVEARGDKVFVLPNPLSPKSLPSAVRKLRCFFKIHAAEYDAVHLHSPSLNEFTLRFASRYGVPVRIMHSHSSISSPSPLKRQLNRILQARVTRYANRFWACSTEAAEFLYGKEFCAHNHVELIANAVDSSAFTYEAVTRERMRLGLGLKNDMPVFAHVSNFSPIKNACFLLNVAKELSERGIDFRLLFVGDGPDHDEVMAKSAAEGVDTKCFFVGRTDDVPSYLQAADCLLLPSIKEGLPVSVVEAQACGLASIVSDTVTRECEAVTGQVKFLPLEVSRWVDALYAFKPASDRTALSKAFKASRFNICNEAARVESLYLEMIGD